LVVKGDKDGNIRKMRDTSVLSNINGYKAISIIGGEFAIASDESEVAIATLLGSCVAMMFYDKVQKVRGMNHFLLPTSGGFTDSFKYGLNSVETMLNSMYKLGCKKEHLEVKIVGGAAVIASSNNIGEKNVNFARDFCRSENIRVSSEHVHGDHGRMVLLANEFKTFIRFVTNSAIEEKIKIEEKKILEVANKKEEAILESGDITLF
jgi:chemotaxis protein CheD